MTRNFLHSPTYVLWPYSSVGIATRYGLDGPGIDFLWRARITASVQTGPGTHPVYYTMSTGFSRR
jgi:hypothetical protein